MRKRVYYKCIIITRVNLHEEMHAYLKRTHVCDKPFIQATHTHTHIYLRVNVLVSI